jgi:hypothetical protein
VGERLAELPLAGGREHRVQHDVLLLPREPLDHLELRVRLEARGVVAVEEEDDVEIALLEHELLRRGLVDDAEHDAVELLRAEGPPVEVVLHPLDLLAVAPRDGLVGAGPGGVVDEPLLAVVLVVVAPDRRGADEPDEGEAAEERREGFLQGHPHRLLAERLHLLDRPHLEVGTDLELLNPLDVELHGLRVEGRAVAEAHARAELERVGPAVVAHLPRGRQHAFELRRPWLEVHERLVDVSQQDDAVAVALDVRVVRDDLAVEPDADRLLGGGGERPRREPREGQRQ